MLLLLLGKGKNHDISFGDEAYKESFKIFQLTYGIIIKTFLKNNSTVFFVAVKSIFNCYISNSKLNMMIGDLYDKKCQLLNVLLWTFLNYGGVWSAIMFTEVLL